MDFSVIPVFGQNVRPALGLRRGASYWLFFDKRTELSPWLVLHRESVNDTELGLLIAGSASGRTMGDTLGGAVLRHFNPSASTRSGTTGWGMGGRTAQVEQLYNAVFTGQVQVVKLPAKRGGGDSTERDLYNPNSIYWASHARLQQQAPGGLEFERNSALVEMGSILLARWREADLQNLEFKSKSRLTELWEETRAIGTGVAQGVMGFVEGLWSSIVVVLQVGINGIVAVCKGVGKLASLATEALIHQNFEPLRHAIEQAGLGIYNTAQELIAHINEGLRLLNLLGNDALIRTGLMEFFDGYGESVPHLRRLQNAGNFVTTIGIEVVLALATFGGSLAVGAARVGAARVSAKASQLASGATTAIRMIGPFTEKAMQHLANAARAMAKATVDAPNQNKLKAQSAGNKVSAKAKKESGTSSVGSQKKSNSSSIPNSNQGPLESTGASTPKARDTIVKGEPISMFNGEELLQLQDCTLPGIIAMPWVRTYRSSLAQQQLNMGLGMGWCHPLGQRLIESPGKLDYRDSEGRLVYFRPLAVGQRCTNTSEELTLHRVSDQHYTVQHRSGLGEMLEFTGEQLLLTRITDTWGNALAIEHGLALGDGQGGESNFRATTVRSSSATWVLRYNPAGLLQSIAQVASESGTNNANSSGSGGDHSSDYSGDANAGDRIREQATNALLNQITLIQYQYNEQGQLTCATDANGHSEHYRYNESHLLTQRTLKSGYPIYFEWEYKDPSCVHCMARCVAQWGAPVGGLPTYRYRFEWEVGGNPLRSAAIDSRGARWEYAFNAQGQCIEEINPLGVVARMYYNAQGKLIKRTRGELRKTIGTPIVDIKNDFDFDADSEANPSRAMPAYAEERWAYNAQGDLIEYTDVLGHVWRYQHNSRGQVVQRSVKERSSQPEAPQRRIGNSQLGQKPAAQIDQQFSYTEQGLLASQTDATGATTRYRYNSMGLLCETLSPLNHSTRWLYNSEGQLLAQINPAGQRTTYRYDTWCRLASIANPLGQSRHFAYDLAGQCTQISNTEGVQQRYAYSPLGQLLRVSDATGRTTEYEYADALSQPTARIDPLGQRLHYHYDSERNLIALTNENGEHHRFEYDLAEQLIRQTGFDGRVQTYRYNTLGHLVEQQQWGVLGTAQAQHFTPSPTPHPISNPTPRPTPHPASTVQYQRDAAGQLVALQAIDHTATTPIDTTNATNATTTATIVATYAYNPYGQLIQANNAHRKLSWEYNAAGLPTQALQDDHQIGYSYDAAGRLRHTEWQTMGPDVPRGELELEYNPLGQVQHIALNGQALTRFEYDPLGRETNRMHANHTASHRAYDPQGRLIAQRLQYNGHGDHAESNGVSSAINWDPDIGTINVNNRINTSGNNRGNKKTTPTILSSKHYHYNTRHQISRIDDHGFGTTLYHYDPLDRLHRVQAPNPEAFLFDPASNLLEHLEGQEAELAHTQRSLPPPGSPNSRRPHQSAGNRLTCQGARSFTYCPRGNRIETTWERGPRRGQTTRYRYNALNQLEQIQHPDGSRTDYAYDALGRRISKQHAGATTTFYWNGPVLLGEAACAEEASKTKGSTYVYEPSSFKPLALLQNNEVLHYHTDHLGTPQELTNAQGELVWQARFKTYGALALAPIQRVAQPLRFQGQYLDEESGLHYNLNRYYDPLCGQFITQDPIGLAGGMNGYQYAPNPVMWIDPWGLKGEEGTEIVASGFIGRGYRPGPGERSLTKDQYKSLMSSSRGQGVALHNQLQSRVLNSEFVYRATSSRTVEFYRQAGAINRDAFMTFDDVGLSASRNMNLSQVFSHWGTPDVMLKIPTSAITKARVPRPFGDTTSVGWEPLAEAYPAAGIGGNSQFLGRTSTWDDSWVIPLTQ